MHYLLLDRESRTLSVAHAALAQRLLREQWGASHSLEPMLIVTEQEWEQLVQDLITRVSPPSPMQIAEH